MTVKIVNYITKQTKNILYSLDATFINEFAQYIHNYKVYKMAIVEATKRAREWQLSDSKQIEDQGIDNESLMTRARTLLRQTNQELSNVGISITPDLQGKIAFQTLKKYIDVKHSEYKGTEGIYDYRYDLSQTVKVDKLPEIDFHSEAVDDEFKNWDYKRLVEMPLDEFGKKLHYYGSIVAYLNNLKWQMEANVTRLKLQGEEIIPGAINGLRNWYHKTNPTWKVSEAHLLNRVKSANTDYLENQKELDQLEAQFIAVKGLARTYEHVFNTMSRILGLRLYQDNLVEKEQVEKDEEVEKIPDDFMKDYLSES